MVTRIWYGATMTPYECLCTPYFLGGQGERPYGCRWVHLALALSDHQPALMQTA